MNNRVSGEEGSDEDKDDNDSIVDIFSVLDRGKYKYLID
jgi:hypothetical protein